MLAGSVGLVLAVVAGWVLADRAVRPIRRAFERQREFAADASHELRTPLAVVDAGLQVLARHPTDTVAAHGETVGAMRDEVGRMNRLVGGLLALARADAGVAEIVPVDTDLDALVRGAVAGYAPLAAARGASIALGETTAGTARVDPDRILELLGILVDNALTHGGPGVHVRVQARRPGATELVVADDGPGIPEAERSRVLERFARGDDARSGGGTGLGLAIAHWIVEAHRGRLVLEDARPGLRVRVTLPV
jgi:signal transduction histidine kinase